MALSENHWVPDWRTWVQGLPSEILPCRLMVLGTCKICHVYNVLQVPIQILPLGVSMRVAILSVVDQK